MAQKVAILKVAMRGLVGMGPINVSNTALSLISVQSSAHITTVAFISTTESFIQESNKVVLPPKLNALQDYHTQSPSHLPVMLCTGVVITG